MLPGDNKIKEDYSTQRNLHIPITAEVSCTGLCSLPCEVGGGRGGGRDACGPDLVVGVL